MIIIQICFTTEPRSGLMTDSGLRQECKKLSYISSSPSWQSSLSATSIDKSQERIAVATAAPAPWMVASVIVTRNENILLIVWNNQILYSFNFRKFFTALRALEKQEKMTKWQNDKMTKWQKERKSSRLPLFTKIMHDVNNKTPTSILNWILVTFSLYS